MFELDDERKVKKKFFYCQTWIENFSGRRHIPLTNQVRGPYCKLWTELAADLWPKRVESYCRTVSGYSAEKTDITLCWGTNVMPTMYKEVQDILKYNIY